MVRVLSSEGPRSLKVEPLLFAVGSAVQDSSGKTMPGEGLNEGRSGKYGSL